MNSQKFILVDSISKKETLIGIEELKFQKNKFQKQGFHFVSFDTIRKKNDSTFYIQPFLNQKIKKIIFEYKVDSSNKSIKQEINKIESCQAEIDIIQNQFIQNGYLKTVYKLDTFYIRNDSFYIKYSFQRNQKYKLDSIHIISTSHSINDKFIRKILKLDKSDRSDIDFKSIVEQVRLIPFIDLDKNPEFTIKDSSAILHIYVKDRKTNQLNAILGLLSNAYNSNSIQFIGDVNLSLNNILRRGISLEINWQKNLANSQFLTVKSSIPYILNTPIGSSINFTLEKFDTSYLRIIYQMSIDYYINTYQSISFLYKNQSSSIDGIDRISLQNGIMPKYLDYSYTQFGIGYKLNKLNKLFFNKKGWKIDANFLIGNKTIEKNENITSLKDNQGNSLEKLYDTLNLSQTVSSFFIDITKYTGITKDLILKSQLESKNWLSENISINEMYYTGGIRKPRGFDDNSLITPNYVTLSNEIQYYLSEYFYSNIFADITIMQNSLDNKKINNPIGLGLGIALKTAGNIFQLNIGTGSLENQKFSISNAKVHINYTNVF